jgi:molybdopterin-biosynthesis enzyme MoeA-like protein
MTASSLAPLYRSTRSIFMTQSFGIIIIGDEILSGKRADKHLPKVIELLGARGLQLSFADYVGDDPARITATLARAVAGARDSGDVVFSCGGIGATPDDHTRQCAARALGVELQLHPEARTLITARMQDLAREQGVPFEPDKHDNIHRLNMGVFPAGAQIIPNPYNRIPGFSWRTPVASGLPTSGQGCGGVYFLPGFPVMAWPMIEWVLDTHYPHLHQKSAYIEKSVIVFGSMEATLTPLMLEIEAGHPAVKVFSLPSVDHPEYGRHVELGIKGAPGAVEAAYPALLAGVRKFDYPIGPELVRP